MTYDIFVSYKREQRKKIEELIGLLTAYGFRVWDDGGLRPGLPWEKQLREHMDRATIILVCLCARSVRPDSWVRNEIQFAIDQDKFFPVQIEKVASLPPELALVHFSDLSDWNGHPERKPITELIRKLDEHLRIKKDMASVRESVSELAAAWQTRGSYWNVAPTADQVEIPDMVVIEPGQVHCGTTFEDGRTPFHTPHLVTVRAPFAVARRPVTIAEFNAQFDAVNQETQAVPRVGRHQIDDSTLPVTDVSWFDAKSYVEWLSGVTRQRYRLLSEAEWEYCCRAGVSGRIFGWGDNVADGRLLANCDWSQPFDGHVVDRDHEPRLLPVDRSDVVPNAFDLIDISGNVWEWVADSFAVSFVESCRFGDPLEDDDSDMGVVRGGSWSSPPEELGCAVRRCFHKGMGRSHIGFRVARDLSPEPRGA